MCRERTKILEKFSQSQNGAIKITCLQSPLFISMRRGRHPYAYKAFVLVGRVDLSHTNLVGTRAGMLVGGLCLYTVCLYRELTVLRFSLS